MVTAVSTYRSRKTGQYETRFEYDEIDNSAEFWRKNFKKFDVENMECRMLVYGAFTSSAYRSYEFHDEL